MATRVKQADAGKTRNRALSDNMLGILEQVGDEMNVTFVVVSGGQTSSRDPKLKDVPGGWTGGHDHDDGNAGDVQMLDANGRAVNFTTANGEALWKEAIARAYSLGARSFGLDTGAKRGDPRYYMGQTTVHIGAVGGSLRTWGHTTKGGSTPQLINDAIAAGKKLPPGSIPQVASQTSTVRTGSKGSSVRELQQQLRAAGFDPGAVDGVFGAKTAKAVREFQVAKGLEADGIAGKQTWAALTARSAPKPAPSPAFRNVTVQAKNSSGSPDDRSSAAAAATKAKTAPVPLTPSSVLTGARGVAKPAANVTMPVQKPATFASSFAAAPAKPAALAAIEDVTAQPQSIAPRKAAVSSGTPGVQPSRTVIVGPDGKVREVQQAGTERMAADRPKSVEDVSRTITYEAPNPAYLEWEKKYGGGTLGGKGYDGIGTGPSFSELSALTGGSALLAGSRVGASVVRSPAAPPKTITKTRTVTLEETQQRAAAALDAARAAQVGAAANRSAVIKSKTVTFQGSATGKQYVAGTIYTNSRGQQTVAQNDGTFRNLETGRVTGVKTGGIPGFDRDTGTWI